MSSAVRFNRLKKELQMLQEEPPSHFSYWAEDDDFKKLQAVIFPDEDSPYRGGTFKLEIEVTERYPFQPPKVRFLTPVYHPNIDSMGRICLDLLKMPPSGSWRPVLNITTILTTIRLLMSSPNPDDPLMAEIAEEFKLNRTLFEENAKTWTLKYAIHSSDRNSLKRKLDCITSDEI